MSKGKEVIGVDRAIFEIGVVSDLLNDLVLEHKRHLRGEFKNRVNNFDAYIQRVFGKDIEEMMDMHDGKASVVVEKWKESVIKALRSKKKKD
jgi:hypothetical protein